MPTLASAHFGISHPALDAELTASVHRRRKVSQRLKTGHVSKHYESRDHIHAKSVCLFRIYGVLICLICIVAQGLGTGGTEER